MRLPWIRQMISSPFFSCPAPLHLILIPVQLSAGPAATPLTRRRRDSLGGGPPAFGPKFQTIFFSSKNIFCNRESFCGPETTLEAAIRSHGGTILPKNMILSKRRKIFDSRMLHSVWLFEQSYGHGHSIRAPSRLRARLTYLYRRRMTFFVTAVYTPPIWAPAIFPLTFHFGSKNRVGGGRTIF